MRITALADGRPPLQRRTCEPPARREPTLFDEAMPAVTSHAANQQLGAAWKSSHQFATALAQVVLESLQGRRTTRQLVRWVDDLSLIELNHQIALRRGQPAEVSCGSVRVQLQHEVAEIAVRFLEGGQSFALAAKIEQVHDRWVCTCLDFGPPGTNARSASAQLNGARGTA